MNETIVVTDLTRFSDESEKVCLAGINPENMNLIRPMPYLKRTDCRDYRILPGTKIAADFNPAPNIKVPHTEDHLWRNWKIIGQAASDEFRELLQSNLSPSISRGFGMDITEKVIPEESAPSKSIITIKAAVQLHLFNDGDFQKIRASVTDSDGLILRFMSITDYGFYRYVQKLLSKHELSRFFEFDRFLRSQSEIFLRLGLGRLWKSKDGRTGFWLQVNGIYTFPEFSEEIRSYE